MRYQYVAAKAERLGSTMSGDIAASSVSTRDFVQEADISIFEYGFDGVRVRISTDGNLLLTGLSEATPQETLRKVDRYLSDLEHKFRDYMATVRAMNWGRSGGI